MQYITARQAADNWNLTVRRVQDLCRNNQIDGAVRWGRDWMIPADAHRPGDRRFKAVTHTAQTIAQLPRKNPAIAMSNLYNSPGTADQVAVIAFPERPVASKLFRAQIAFCRGQVDTAVELVREMEQIPRGHDLQIGCGVILGMCALFKGDHAMWKEAKNQIQTAPCYSNRDRYAMEFWMAAIESELRETNTFPLWFARGVFDILPGDSFPGARFYYLRYLYLMGNEYALGQRGTPDAQNKMSLLPFVAEPLIAQSRKEGALISEVYMRLLCAASYHDMGDDAMAIRHLDIAISLALPNKLYLLLAEYRRQLDFLLDERLNLVDPAAVTQVKNLNKQFLAGWTELHSAERGRMVSNQLTTREREVAKNAAFGQSNMGDGTETSNRIGFYTQLTAAWTRAKMQSHYGTTPKFYTLGVETGNESVATSVLNPAASSDTLNEYWDDFLNGTVNYQGNVQVGDSWWVYKDSAITSQNYVDQYWLATNASGMISAFKQIVNEIVLQSASYSTLVEAAGEDLSGYVTFEDKLGVLMEVKNIKGLVLGNRIFTGAELAKSLNAGLLGTVDAPSAYGNELVATVKERLGITDNTTVQRLIGYAYNASQLSYASDTRFSNYIGWYADDSGNYKGFWQESYGSGLENAPEGATYINKSYGYLGAESTAEGASDMMHVVVMVHTHIATGDQTVVYKIPASLIPTAHYEVGLDGSNVATPKSITRTGATPLQLLVEVGLRSDINAINIYDKVAQYVQAGGHIHKNANGTYSFYTNQWGDGDGGEVNYDEPLTHLTAQSHFHPALNNSRYYFATETLIYSDASVQYIPAR